MLQVHFLLHYGQHWQTVHQLKQSCLGWFVQIWESSSCLRRFVELLSLYFHYSFTSRRGIMRCFLYGEWKSVLVLNRHICSPSVFLISICSSFVDRLCQERSESPLCSSILLWLNSLIVKSAVGLFCLFFSYAFFSSPFLFLGGHQKNQHRDKTVFSICQSYLILYLLRHLSRLLY